MKSSQYYYNPKVHYAIQDTPLPFNSSLVEKKFLYTPCIALSFSQKPDIYPPDESNGRLPVIAAIYGGTFLG